MKYEITLSKDIDNNELEELQMHLRSFSDVNAQIKELVVQRDMTAILLNRVIRSAVDRARLEDDTLRSINFPPFLSNGKLNYEVKGDRIFLVESEQSRHVTPVVK